MRLPSHVPLIYLFPPPKRQSGKTGAIIASKKGAATLLQKSLAILGVTTSREVNLMMAACLQLALSRVLLFLRLNSLEAYLSSRFFIHSSTYLGRVRAPNHHPYIDLRWLVTSRLTSLFYSFVVDDDVKVASMSAINSAQLIAKASILGALVAFLVEEIHLFVLFLRVWKVNGEKGLDLRQFIKYSPPQALRCRRLAGSRVIVCCVFATGARWSISLRTRLPTRERSLAAPSAR